MATIAMMKIVVVIVFPFTWLSLVCLYYTKSLVLCHAQSESIPYLRGYDASVDHVLGPHHGCCLASAIPIMMIGRMIAVSIAVVMSVLIIFVSLCVVVVVSCMSPIITSYRPLSMPIISYSRILRKYSYRLNSGCEK